MQVFADDGTRIDVRVDGEDGTPIVLLAGFPLTRAIWNVQADALSKSHRVVRLELRGIGTSSVPDGPYLMETLASDVATALDALGMARAAIAGHSMGGYVALAFARMFVERVSHLALVCSRLTADAPERAAARRRLADAVERTGSIQPVLRDYVTALIAGTPAPSYEAIENRVRTMATSIEPKAAAALLRGMALRCDSRDIAPDVAVPVCVIAGTNDPLVPIAESHDVAAAFPRGRLVACERSGHLPMLQQPECVAEALDVWLSE